MPLSKLQFRPGVVRDITSYSNEGGWYDIDNVRFQKGFPEKIGGWQKKSNQSFLGTCRSLHPWVTLSRDQYLGVGTHLKFYVDEGGAFNDITPIRSTTSAERLRSRQLTDLRRSRSQTRITAQSRTTLSRSLVLWALVVTSLLMF